MAKTVEVLLQQNVLKLGNMGDIVRVKVGYARNFLLPHGKGILASGAAKRQIEVLQERAAKMETEHVSQAQAQAARLTGLRLTIKAKVSHDRHLFGSVGVREIVTALAGQGFTLDPRQVHLNDSFKELGSYEVVLRLYKKIDAIITVEVVDSDPAGRGLREVIDEITAPPAVAGVPAEDQA
jgi:large subunit ribosomal protein L9